MKDKVINFYLAKCQIQEDDIYRTKAYKFGITEENNFEKRGIKNEFYKLLNTFSKNIPTQQQIVKPVETDEKLFQPGPEFFIRELENYVKSDYFLNDQKFFNTKEEYIAVCEESHNRFDKLIEVMSKYEEQINRYNSSYEEIKSDQVRILDEYNNFYMKLLEQIKKDLSNSSSILAKLSSNPVNTSAPPIKTATNKKDVYSCLVTDFILYKKGSKYYLQHNIYHKGKNPLDPKGSFSVDTSKPNSDKFQWTSKNFCSQFQYKQKQGPAKKIISYFKNKIIDLDTQPTQLIN